MKLGAFSLGTVIHIGIAATVFIIALKWAGKKWPQLPIVAPLSRSV